MIMLSSLPYLVKPYSSMRLIHRKLFKSFGTQRFNSVRILSLIHPINDFTVKNEPVKEYLPGSDERKQLEKTINQMKDECHDIPIVIGGKEHRTQNVRHQLLPFDHDKQIAKYYWATPELLQEAIKTAEANRVEWERVPIGDKISIFLKAGDLVSTKYRQQLNAATMLGQAKTVIQAEIDAAAELADFFRFNAFFAKELHKYQPISEDRSTTINTFRYRGIEGFIAAISPFNFTAIGGNLASAPALMGNVVLWKPSDTAILSNYIIFKLLVEAGFPNSVINFVPSEGKVFGNVITKSEHLAGVNFTGSVATFKLLWKLIADNLDVYRNFPRIVGECGGKNYHFVHPLADLETVIPSTIRAAFEFGGQKCSACSRLYVPQSKWLTVKEGLRSICKKLKLGSPLDYDTFLSAVIDEASFNKIRGYIEYAKSSPNCNIIEGGDYDKRVGYYIKPTIIEVKDINDKLMTDEIFGPVLSVYVYKDEQADEILTKVADHRYALTGAIFSKDENFLQIATEKLKMSAGNFYVNDKSTGSVVGQQPFGGGRLSGTNDKAGGPHYLLRWTSAQNIKQTFVPMTQWNYRYMEK